MTFYLPDDDGVLRAIGIVSVRHAHLDYILKLAIGALDNVPSGDVVKKHKLTGSRKLRKEVRTSASKALNGAPEVKRLGDLLDECEKTTGRRNRLIHDISVRNYAGEPKIRTKDGKWRDPPEVTDLKSLAEELIRLTNEIHDALEGGYLDQALAAKRTTKP